MRRWREMHTVRILLWAQQNYVCFCSTEEHFFHCSDLILRRSLHSQLTRNQPNAMLVRLVSAQDNERSLTPESSAQDLGVEPLLVLAYLWRVVLGPCVDRVDVNHRSLTRRVLPQSLLQSSFITVTWPNHRQHLHTDTSSNISSSLASSWLHHTEQISAGLKDILDISAMSLF